MTVHGRSGSNSICLASAVLGLMLFSPPQSFAADAVRPLLSLTVAERSRLPDNTRVSLPWMANVTLGQLRAEHRARAARFSQAGAWGKRVADTVAKPGPPLSGTDKTATKAAAEANNHYADATLGMRKPRSTPQSSGEKIAKTTEETNPSGTLAGSRSVAPNPFLVQRQGHPGTPLPLDYQLFCDGARASACIYLPPNTTLASAQASGWLGLEQQIRNAAKGDFDQFFIDVDPLITDQSFCHDWKGIWVDASQVCEFWYFSTQRTNFNPKGSPASAASCGPQTNYQVDPKQGTVTASLSSSGNSIATGATPIACVVQVWMYP